MAAQGLPRGPMQPVNPLPVGQGQIVAQETTTLTVGPIPDPAALKQYEAVKPGFAERIVAMAEKQAGHRQQLEADFSQARIKDITAERSERKRGQYVGAFVVVCALSSSTAIAIWGSGPWATLAAGAIGGIPLVGLVIAFMSGSKSKEKEAK